MLQQQFNIIYEFHEYVHEITCQGTVNIRSYNPHNVYIHFCLRFIRKSPRRVIVCKTSSAGKRILFPEIKVEVLLPLFSAVRRPGANRTLFHGSLEERSVVAHFSDHLDDMSPTGKCLIKPVIEPNNANGLC